MFEPQADDHYKRILQQRNASGRCFGGGIGGSYS
jgi:hypothetical protein